MTLSTDIERGVPSPLSVDELPVAVLRLERGEVVAVNRQWVSWTGLSIEASLGTGWLSAVHTDFWPTARRFADVAGIELISEWSLVNFNDRRTLWVQATAARGGPLSGVVVLTKIDARKEVEAGLRHRASHDSLTGLLNRVAFIARVRDACERASDEFDLCAVLYLDLDHFKDINDALGHSAGDRVLAAVSRRLRASLRPSDLLGRLGGDELGVLCPVLETEAEAIHLAERLVSTVRQPITIDERVIHIGVSIGVAFSSGAASAALDLIEEADQLMYRAKARGRGQWATLMTQAATGTSNRSTDVARAGAAIARAEHDIGEVLDGLDLRSSEWDRLVQGSHALARARSILEDDWRIG
jgi:diguanylate cyclase (GGDEF)-like protein